MNLEPPDWRSSLEEVLEGVDNEFAGPSPAGAVLEDLKVMLDDTRNVIQAYGSTSDTAAYLKELREVRLRRTVGVCTNVLRDVQAGRIPKETLGIPELREVLDDITARLNVAE